MIKLIRASRFFMAESIHLKGKEEPIENSFVCFTDRFAIVSPDAEGIKPTWYNIDQIDKIVGIEPARI